MHEVAQLDGQASCRRLKFSPWVIGTMICLFALACTAPPPASTAPGASQPTGEQSAAAAPPAAAALTRLRVGLTATATALAGPLWVARDAGYFQQEGLDIDVVRVEPGATVLAAMHSGELDMMATSASSFTLGYLQGFETLMIGATTDDYDGSLVVQPTIGAADELKGKTIAISRLKSITDVAAREMLQRAGLRVDEDVYLRPAGTVAQSLAAIEAGVVAGASIDTSTVPEARKRGQPSLLRINLPYVSSAMGGTKTWLAGHQALGDQYLRATARAVQRMQTDREYTLGVMGANLGTDDREQLAFTVDLVTPRLVRDLRPSTAALQAVLDLEDNPAATTTRPEELVDWQFTDRLRDSGFVEQLSRQAN